ncbi:MAG: S8 family serine peptidase [Chloroflexota bacterium]
MGLFRKLTSLIGVILLFVLLGSNTGIAAADEPDYPHVEGELIVGFSASKGISKANSIALAKGVGADVKNRGKQHLLLSFRSDQEAKNSVKELLNYPGVTYVEPNYIYQIDPVTTSFARPQPGSTMDSFTDESENLLFNPDDKKFGKQWHLNKIQFNLTDTPEANPPCIVVIDSGVNYDHPDLQGKVYKGIDTIQNDMNPMDKNRHGTHVAGISAGKTNNARGIAGVSPNSNILAVRVLDAGGGGTAVGVADGIEWANTAGAAECGGQEPLIYNLSLGGPESNVISVSIATAKGMGRLIVAAAGNDNQSTKFDNHPGADINTFAVASTEDNNQRSWFSNYDKPVNPWVHIAAPGTSVLSTYLTGYGTLSGTSMATPVIAGAAARVWAQNPGWTAQQVQDQLINTGSKAKGFLTGTKVVNLYRALGGSSRTLQGRVLSAGTNATVGGARVKIKLKGTSEILCSKKTTIQGFYVCINLPQAGTYKVIVTKDGMAKTHRFFKFQNKLMGADITISDLVGAGSGKDWIVTTLWKGQEPYTDAGKEMDLWFVDVTNPGSPVCYASWTNKQAGSPWKLLMPSDSWSGNSPTKQTEAGWVKQGYVGERIQVWVILWDHNAWPKMSRITDSKLFLQVYKGNHLIRSYKVPTAPQKNTSDHWFVGTMKLNFGQWAVTNQIKENADLPGCVTHN